MGLKNFFFRAHVDGRATPLQAGPRGSGSMSIELLVDDHGSERVATARFHVVTPRAGDEWSGERYVVSVETNRSMEKHLLPARAMGFSEYVPKSTKLLALQRELQRDGTTLEEWALEILKGNLDRDLRWEVPS